MRDPQSPQRSEPSTGDLRARLLHQLPRDSVVCLSSLVVDSSPERAGLQQGEVLLSTTAAPSCSQAETNTLSAIPMSMLHWAIETGMPYGSLQNQYGLTVEIHPTRHGGPALDLLVTDRVDLALIPYDMINLLAPHCVRGSLLSKVTICGISIRPVESVFDLKGKRFGVLSGSAFATLLAHASSKFGLELAQTSWP